MNLPTPGIRDLCNSVLATCLYQLQSSFRIQRIAVTLILTAFPPVMLSFAILGSNTLQGGVPYLEFVIVLLVSVVCILSLLLWATPNVYTELEGKSWIFLACRPRGRIACFLGKFLASFLTAFLISFFSLTACILIAEQFVGIENALRCWLALVGIYLLATMAYASLMSLIGTVAVRRSMVIAAGFVIGWEIILAQIPTIVSRFTVRYHLQSIGFEWMGWFIPNGILPKERYYEIYGQPWLPGNYAALLLITAFGLVAGCMVITRRQYITSDET